MRTQFSLPKFCFIAIALLGMIAIWPAQSPNLNSLGNGLAPSSAFAGVGVANDESQTLFTASQDGKTIYMWQYFSSKPPKFIGQAQAILVEKAK